MVFYTWMSPVIFYKNVNSPFDTNTPNCIMNNRVYFFNSLPLKQAVILLMAAN